MRFVKNSREIAYLGEEGRLSDGKLLECLFLSVLLIYFKMSQTLQNSYLQRYQLRQSREPRAQNKSAGKSPAASPHLPPDHSLPAVVSKLEERVDGIDVKMTSLLNVVKLLQKYTETRDDQYEKEKENEAIKKGSESQCGHHCAQISLKLKQFDLMSKQFKDELKSIQRIKSNIVMSEMNLQKHQGGGYEGTDLEALEEGLREEINKKMDICVKLINTSAGGQTERAEKGLAAKVNELAFNLNQLQNQCRRNRMLLEKEIDGLASMVKDSSTAVPIHSRVTQREALSKSPNKGHNKNLTHNKSKNSRSDQSLSKGKQNKSAVLVNLPKEGSRVREEEMKEALRRKREHRQRLKVRNF